MTLNEIRKTVRDRAMYAANFYGSRWREEKEILDASLEAIDMQLEYAEADPDAEVPDDASPVLVLYSGVTERNEIVNHDTGIGWYNGEWRIDGAKDFIIHKWRLIPEWSEEALDDDEGLW